MKLKAQILKRDAAPYTGAVVFHIAVVLAAVAGCSMEMLVADILEAMGLQQEVEGNDAVVEVGDGEEVVVDA